MLADLNKTGTDLYHHAKFGGDPMSHTGWGGKCNGFVCFLLVTL